jgi:K+-transporting ATPase ATPase C chain
MAPRNYPILRQLGAALRTLLLLTVLLGLAYPLTITGIAQIAFRHTADGSLITRHNTTIGSSLIGQAFTLPVLKNGQPTKDATGNPIVAADPRYFQSRPSAAGPGYDPTASGASNLGPTNPVLIAAITTRRATDATLDGVNPNTVPPDALTTSGSGLDPDISPAYATEQIPRIARQRHLTITQVQALVAANTKGRTLGILGEPRVNVLDLNLALNTLKP